MKKAIAVLLVIVVVTASAFAFSFRSLGIETGNGYFISGDMDIIDNLDVYVRLGYYTGEFGLSVGGQYKVGDFKLEGTNFDFKPGLQLNFGIGKPFVFSVLATAQVSYDSGHFRAFVRPGIGFGLTTIKYNTERFTDTYFAWAIETGVAYLFK